MNRLLLLISFLLVINLLFQQCANPIGLSGGLKDTIPPILIRSYPINGTTSFSDQEIRLEFSEFINADKLKQQLIITPKININYKSSVKRNQLIMKFSEPFPDSTTYNIIFAEAITDITEKNPAVNLSLAFSTGTFIDSMKIQGKIIELFKKNPVSNYTVGLYPFSDTLDFFTQSPVYFATTNDSGMFMLNYIKSGTYKILAFDDDNSNILLDPEAEAHGFIADSIQLDSILILEQPIYTLIQDVKPLQFINGRPTGPYIELKYSKTIDEYNLKPDTFLHNVVGENKNAIRIYKPKFISYGDSIEIFVTANDSLNNSSTDTVKAAFLQSNKKPTDFSYSIHSTSPTLIDNHLFKIQFNKPITITDSLKVQFAKDSTFQYEIIPEISWNHNFTELSLHTLVNRDSLISDLELSLSKNAESSENYETDTSFNEPTVPSLPSAISFVIESGSLISVENDSIDREIISVPFFEKDSYGTIEFSLTTTKESFVLQLLDSKNKVAYRNWNEKNFTFSQVKVDTYEIRILIDTNEDGKWSAGNLLLNQEPEAIYLYPESTSVRENWILEIDISF